MKKKPDLITIVPLIAPVLIAFGVSALILLNSKTLIEQGVYVDDLRYNPDVSNISLQNLHFSGRDENLVITYDIINDTSFIVSIRTAVLEYFDGEIWRQVPRINDNNSYILPSLVIEAKTDFMVTMDIGKIFDFNPFRHNLFRIRETLEPLADLENPKHLPLPEGFGLHDVMIEFFIP
ncbi:MAG: hypothetical protein FWE33_06650 [Defluviitaleaceae bacterium]|nr:hypothetical protein [Defluviitaleaceae bacterium]